MSVSLPFTPPTDNLYKFVALSGLILVLGAPVYWIGYQIALDEREENYLHAHLEVVGAKVEPYEPLASFDAALHGQKLTPTPTPLPDERTRTEAKKRELYNAFIGLKPYSRFRAAVNVVSALAEIAGLFLAAWGFRRWYQRVQVLQDQLLAKQLETKPNTST